MEEVNREEEIAVPQLHAGKGTLHVALVPFGNEEGGGWRVPDVWRAGEQLPS